MIIKLFTDNLGPGGAQRQLVGLGVLLKKSGHDVSVVLYYDIPFYADYLRENGIHFEVLNNTSNPLRRIYTFYKYFKNVKPDWVIAYQETPSLVSSICRVLGCKFHLLVSERNTTQSISLIDRLRFFLYKFADVIIPNSYSQGNFLTINYPWMKSKLMVIPNFVDLELFSPVKHKRRVVPIILVAASVIPSKNTIGMIHAVKILKERGLKFQVNWYGLTGKITPYQISCLEKIKELKIADSISILQKTKDINLKYKDADYFCLPSFYEGTPNVICEAIATGLPIICSSVCDNGYYVKENLNGFLFDPHNYFDIADKVEKLLNLNEFEYKSFCIKSRKIAEENLSDKIFLDNYLKVINK